jgi:hypothetical protein
MTMLKKKIPIVQDTPFIRIPRSRPEQGWVRSPAHRKRRRGDVAFVVVIVALALSIAWLLQIGLT